MPTYAMLTSPCGCRFLARAESVGTTESELEALKRGELAQAIVDALGGRMLNQARALIEAEAGRQQ